MQIDQVTLDNGTTIGFGIDDNGNPDLTTITVETDHEYVEIRPRINTYRVEDSVTIEVSLSIDLLDESPVDLEFGSSEVRDTLNQVQG
jgi:hypothetical protein